MFLRVVSLSAHKGWGRGTLLTTFARCRLAAPSLPTTFQGLSVSALSSLLDAYRTIAQTQREEGTYFEDLIVCYLKNEPKYRDLYENVWTYADWARVQGINAQDAGIDLVALVKAGDVGQVRHTRRRTGCGSIRCMGVCAVRSGGCTGGLRSCGLPRARATGRDRTRSGCR